jgi:hypothetical protein
VSYRLRGFGDAGVPITCASDEQVTPIKAWVNSPNDPDYLAVTNWHCVKKSQMALDSGFTFSAGLKTWANPLGAVTTIPAAVGDFSNHPEYSAGVLLPVAAVAAWFMFGRSGGGSARRYGR